MTDERNDASAPPPEPSAPPVPRRSRPWGWIVAALLALTLIVLALLYFMGMFEGGQRREEVPWNSSDAAPAAEPALPAAPAPAPAPATGGQVTAQWLLGGWGQDCPAVNDPVFVFQPGGRLLFPPNTGTWTLAGDRVTVTINGRDAVMIWEHLGPDSARVTRTRNNNVYYVQRCPGR